MTPTIPFISQLSAEDEFNWLEALSEAMPYEAFSPPHPFWAHPNMTVLPRMFAPTNMITASKIVVCNIRNY